ncbi:MAG: PIG-L family deacetylase [Chloroflexi bacterium]|nr:PIG-L family deacetylase [Chloroflexota bacterium]
MPERVDFLAIRPHPDDESSATGGLLAKYAAEGRRTGVVTCTGGEEGEIHDPDLVYEEAFPRLRSIRERELLRACEVLGVAELRLLGYRDSGMVGVEANQHPDAFMNADLDEAGVRVAAIVRELRPRVIVTENAEGSYGHPDHVMCHRVAVRGWELAADPSAPVEGEPWRPERLYVMSPVFEGWEEVVDLMRAEGLDTAPIVGMLERRAGRFPSAKVDDVTAAIDVSAYVETQRAALLCHRTQIPADSFFVRLPITIARRAFRTAYLTRLDPLPINGERDARLFSDG